MFSRRKNRHVRCLAQVTTHLGKQHDSLQRLGALDARAVARLHAHVLMPGRAGPVCCSLTRNRNTIMELMNEKDNNSNFVYKRAHGASVVSVQSGERAETLHHFSKPYAH